MASYQQLNYCKKCKKNVSVNEKGQCVFCKSTQFRKSWSVRFRYVEQSGIEVQKRLSGYSTKKEAQEEYLKFISTAKQYKPVDENNKKLSFNQLYNEYVAYLTPRVKESTLYDFELKAKKFLNFFSNYEVKKITPKILLDWQNGITNYSYNYQCHIRNCLYGMLRYAEKYYDIVNPLNKVDSIARKTQKKEMQVWTEQEFLKAMEHVHSFEYKTFFSALFYTGARKGEIMATTWKDWDLKTQTLDINKSITKKVKNGGWIITTPKNQSSIRNIKLPSKLVSLLEQLKASFSDLSGFVFGGDKPLSETSIARIFERAAIRAKLKPIRIHDLRHSHASLLISRGATIVTVAKRLGHNSIEQTLNTYAHMMPEDEDNLIKLIENRGT